jgi:hypothetical protein
MAKKAKYGSGKRFKAVQSKVEAEYRKKGKSPEEAKRIAGAIAAKAGRAKHGAKSMAKVAAAGRKRAAKKG